MISIGQRRIFSLRSRSMRKEKNSGIPSATVIANRTHWPTSASFFEK